MVKSDAWYPNLIIYERHSYTGLKDAKSLEKERHFIIRYILKVGPTKQKAIKIHQLIENSKKLLKNAIALPTIITKKV